MGMLSAASAISMFFCFAIERSRDSICRHALRMALRTRFRKANQAFPDAALSGSYLLRDVGFASGFLELGEFLAETDFDVAVFDCAEEWDESEEVAAEEKDAGKEGDGPRK